MRRTSAAREVRVNSSSFGRHVFAMFKQGARDVSRVSPSESCRAGHTVEEHRAEESLAVWTSFTL